MRSTRLTFLFILAGLAGYSAAAEINPAVPSQTLVTPGQVNSTAPAQTGATPSANAVAGNNIILTLANTPFEDISGQAQGRLNYLVVNPNGQIDLAVLDVGTRLVPVPWQLVSTAPNTLVNQPQLQAGSRPLFRVALDQQQLQQAPNLQQNGLSQLIQPDTTQQLLGFYGISGTGNTAMGGANRLGTGTISGAGSSPFGGSSNGNLNVNNPLPGGVTTTSPFVTPFPNAVQQTNNAGQISGQGNQTAFPNTAFPESGTSTGNQNNTGQTTPGATAPSGLALPGQPTPPPALPLGPPPDATAPITPQSPPAIPSAPAGGTGGASGGGTAGGSSGGAASGGGTR